VENRDRDKLNRNDDSSESSNVNRDSSRRSGNLDKDSTVDFGEKIGRSENWENEPSRRSGSTGGSSSGNNMEH